MADSRAPRLWIVARLLAETVALDTRTSRHGRWAVPSPRALRALPQPPLFVIGAPRSGTTFIGDCLGAAPSLSYHYEPPVLREVVRRVGWGDWDTRFAGRVFRLTYRSLRLLDPKANAVRVADKTPEHAFTVQLLDAVFPGAQFVLMIRDGRDVATSLAQMPWLRGVEDGRRRGEQPRFWVEPERAQEFTSTTDFHRAVWAWRRYTEAALAARALGADRYQEVRYEDLTTDPRGVATKLLDFIGLWDEGDRVPFLAVASTAHGDAVGRWRSGLSEDEHDCAWQEAGDLLSGLGYSP